MKQKENISLCVLFIVAIWLVPIVVFLSGDREFSENENRYLAGRPVFSMDNILSGKFMEDTQKFLDDQFPAREACISLKTDIQRFLGNREINGVYLCRDDYLIERWSDSEFCPEQLMENIRAVNGFASVHEADRVSVIIVPTAGLVLEDKLPQNAPMFDQNIALDMLQNNLRGCSYIDLRKVLSENRDQYLYFKTDHHWTARGACLAYQAWRGSEGEALSERKFEYNVASGGFHGSLYSKILNRGQAFDSIEMLKEQIPCSVAYNFGRVQSESIYSMERLEEKDKYQVFLNGNHPEITIRSENKNGEKLLIFKDSFANVFVPFIVGDYESIHIIDLRYFNKDIEKYISENHITRFLFLYNIKNFSEDTDLKSIL